MENHNGEFIQFPVNNDIEFNPVPLFAYRKREGVVPLWDVVDRHSGPEYFQFEVHAQPIQDDTDNADIENLSENCQWCHLCDVSVPIAFLEEHRTSAKHLDCTAIAQASLQRLSKQLSVPPPAPRPPPPGTYYCLECACAVSSRRRPAHAHSSAHRSAAAHDRMLRALHTVYLDRCSAHAQYAALHSDYRNYTGPCPDRGHAASGDSGTNGREGDSCNRPGLRRGDDLGPSEIRSEVKEDECSIITADVESTGATGTQEELTKKRKRTRGRQKNKKKTDEASEDHEETSKNVNKNEIIIMTSYGTVLKVDLNHYHGLHNSPLGLVCRLCRCNVYNKEAHKVDTDHVSRVAVPVCNKHGIRKIDSLWQHCILCNETIAYTNVTAHVKEAKHVTCLENALIQPEDDTQPDVQHVSEEGRTQLNTLLSFNETKKATINDTDEKELLKDAEIYRIEADGLYHIMQNKAEENLTGHRDLEYMYTKIHALNKHHGNVKEGNEQIQEYVSHLKHCDIITEEVGDIVLEDTFKFPISEVEVKQPNLTVDILYDEEHKIDDQEKVNNQPETNDIKICKKLVYPNNSKAHLVNNKIITHSDETYYCEACAVYVHKPALTDHLIREKHKSAFRDQDEATKYHKAGAGVFVPDVVKQIPEIIEFVFDIYPDNRLKCIICDVYIPTTAYNFQDHFEGSKHKKSLSENTMKINADNDITKCLVCKVSFPNSVKLFKNHIEGEKHKVSVNRNDTLNTNNKDKAVDDNESQNNESESNYDSDDSFVSCKESPEKTEVLPRSTVTENVTPQHKIDDKLTNDTSDAASNVSVSETSDISESTDDSYIKGVNHLLDSTRNINELKCKICDCAVPNKTTTIIEHFEGIKHTNKYESLLLSNMIREMPENYSCVACNVAVPKPDLFDHIKMVIHRLKNKEPSTSKQTDRQTSSKGEDKVTDKSVQKIIEIDNFDLTEILKHLFNLMTRIGPKELHCKICNSELKHDFEYVEKHANSREHKRNYTTLLQEHEIKKVDSQIFCEICKTKLYRLEILEHIFGEIHKENFIINKLDKIKPPSDEYNCSLCNEKMVNNPNTIALHNMGVCHMSNAVTVKMTRRYYYCQVCNIKIPRTQALLHNNGIDHIKNLSENQKLATTTSNNTITSIKCNVCNIYIPNIPKNIREHNNGVVHKNNEKKTMIKTVENPTTNKFGQVKCKVCNVYVPNHPTNIDQHNRGSFHKDNEKRTKATQNKPANIETPSTSTTNNTGSVKCEICDVNITNNTMNIIVHNNSVAHKNNEIKAINSAKTQNSATNVPNKTVYICNVCKVDVPNNPMNINQHNNGSYHKENLTLKLVQNPTDKRLVHNGICLVCDVNVPSNGNNIKTHVNGTKHKSMAKKFTAKNRIEKAQTSSVTKVAHSNAWIKIINDGMCAFCSICSVSMLNEFVNINGHVNSEKHQKNVWEYVKSKAIDISMITLDDKKHFCDICEVEISDTATDIKQHYDGLLHKSNVEKFRQRHISLYPSNNSSISRSSSIDTSLSSSNSHKTSENAIPSTSGINIKKTNIEIDNSDNIVASDDKSDAAAKSKTEIDAVKTSCDKTEKTEVVDEESENIPNKEDADETKTQDNEQAADKDTSNKELTKITKETDTDENDGHYLCVVCKRWIPNNTIDINNHMASFIHINAKTSLKETKDSKPEAPETEIYVCEICKRNVPRNTIDIRKHEESAIHKSYFEEVMTENSIDIRNDKLCYCKLCDLYFNKHSVANHVKRDSHIKHLSPK